MRNTLISAVAFLLAVMIVGVIEVAAGLVP